MNLPSRPVVLMGLLLAVIAAVLAKPLWSPFLHEDRPGTLEDSPPLPGTNEITGLKVQADEQGVWKASFDYYYTGAPKGANLRIGLSSAAGPESSPMLSAHLVRRGRHHVELPIQALQRGTAFTTNEVSVDLFAVGKVQAITRLQARIDWPDWTTWRLRQELALKSPDEVMVRAVDLIDQGNEQLLDEAKRLIEALLLKDPRLDAGYVELARIAMKSNWGPEGLHQAENLLASALQIRPDSANAQILLGYVYAHQGRYKPAQERYAAASATDTRNLWLWANWGELLTMQGRDDEAIQKYRVAVTHAPTHDTYDRARLFAYEHLLELLRKRRDLDGMQALHVQRVSEYGQASCLGVSHARFMLQERGDAVAAMLLARQAIDGFCPDPAATNLLGLAHYVAWAGAEGAQREALMNQARVFRPASAGLLYELAASERTAEAARQLIANGEPVDQLDNQRYTALAYALDRRDYVAAKRLLKLGAKPDMPAGQERIPVALMPVLNGDVEGIRVLQRAGVDYAKLRYQGRSAVDLAKQLGHRPALDLLQARDRVL